MTRSQPSLASQRTKASNFVYDYVSFKSKTFNGNCARAYKRVLEASLTVTNFTISRLVTRQYVVMLGKFKQNVLLSYTYGG